MPANSDRPNRGVLVCASTSDDGAMRISLDDVVRTGNDSAGWAVDCLYTFKDYDAKRFDALDFDEKELAAFGYSILARLYAFKQRGEL